MLKILRDNLKYLSWILWVVILVFIAFVFVDFGGGLSGRGARSAAATVGGDSISYAEFQRSYRQLEEQYRRSFGEQLTPELEKQLKLPLQALDRLVDQKILMGEAERLGLGVSDEELRSGILSIPGMKDEQGTFVGREAYERFARSNGFTVRDFEEAMREQIELEKLNSVYAATVSVSADEVERAYREQSEKASIRFLLLPSGKVQAKAEIAPAEVTAYFNAHREEYRLPEQRIVDYLLVDAIRLRAKSTPTADDIRRYYSEHQSDYQQEEQVHARHILLKVDEKRTAGEAEKELQAIRTRVEKGEEFAKIAGQVSDDPGSKTRGGDLGYFGRGKMLKEFEEAAFGAAPNSIVGPVHTSFGVHLIQVLDKRAGGVRPLSEVEGQIRGKLAGDRADAAAEAKAKDLSDRIAKEKLATGDELKKLADGESVVFFTTPPFGKQDAIPTIGRNPSFASAAFELAPGKVSPPIKLPRGFVLLALRDTKAPHLPEQSEVEARLRSALQRDKSGQAAVAELQSARAAVVAGKSLDDVAKGLGLEAKDSGEFGHGGYVQGLGSDKAVVDLALTLAKGATGGPVAVAQGAVLFQVTDRKTFDPAAFAKEREATRVSLERQAVNRFLSSMLSRKKREMKVNYDRPLLERFGILDDTDTGKKS